MLSGSIAQEPQGAEPGAWVRVLADSGEVLGFGHYSPRSSIRVRMLAFGKEDPGEALLVCVSPPSHLYLNSTFVNLDRLRSKTAKGEVWMHPDDAAARGLADGDPVAVSNARGQLRLSVRLRAGLAVGTVCIPGIEWPKLGGQGAGVNDLTSQQETDFGGGATFRPAEEVRLQQAGRS